MKKIFFLALLCSCGGNTKYSANEELVSKTACESRYENGEVIMDCNGSVVNMTDMVNKEMIKMFGSVENMRGPQGPRGDTGQAGRDGTSIQGAPGRDGLDGVAGPQGPEGAIGPSGPRGNVGPQGIKGDVGTSCWDLNNNGVFDSATEDTDKDGIRSVRDCIVEYDSSDGLPIVNVPVSVWQCTTQECRDAHPQQWSGNFPYATFDMDCAYPYAIAFVEIEFYWNFGYGMNTPNCYQLFSPSLPSNSTYGNSNNCTASFLATLDSNPDGTFSANIRTYFLQQSYYNQDNRFIGNGLIKKLRVTPFCAE